MTSILASLYLLLAVPAHADSTGEDLPSGQYERMGHFVEGLAPVGINGKWGFVDSSGTLVIPAIYEDWTDFSGGKAYVSHQGLMARIDRNGILLEKRRLVDFSMSTRTAPSLVPFIAGDKVGYRSLKGEVTVPPVFEDGGAFTEGLAPVKKDSLWGFIDEKGLIAIEPEYDMARSFSEGFATVLKDGKWGFIDSKGKLRIKNEFDSVKPFTEGLAPVRKGFKWGYADKSGSLAITPGFTYAGNFSHGTAMVSIAEPAPPGVKPSPILFHAQIDRSGKIRYRYSAGGACGDIHIISSSEGKYGLISSVTGLILEPRYEEILPAGEGCYFTFREKGKYGFLHPSGAIAAKAVFEEAGHLRAGVAKVRSSGKYGLVNSSGTFILPAEYDSLSWDHSRKLRAFRNGEAGEIDTSAWRFIPLIAPVKTSTDKGEPAPTDTAAYLEEAAAQIAEVKNSFSDSYTCEDLVKSPQYPGLQPLETACGLNELEEKAEKEKCFPCYLALAEHYSQRGSDHYDYYRLAKNAAGAIALVPGDPRPYKLRAAAGVAQEDESYPLHFKQSISDYLELIRLDNADPGIKTEACLAGGKSPGLLDKDTIEVLIRLCGEALSTRPGDLIKLLARAKLLATAGRSAEAMQDLDAALKSNGNYPPLFLAKARIHEGLKDWRKAAFYYSKAIENTSGYVDPGLNGSRGKCYLRLGHCDKAKEDLEAAERKLNGVENKHLMASYHWVCGKDTRKTIGYIRELLSWGEQCEGACYRPEEYSEFLGGLAEIPEYRDLLKEFSGKY